MSVRTIRKYKRIFSSVITAGLIAALVTSTQLAWADSPTTMPTNQTIVNDVFYKDINGNPIYSQGGGIFDFTDPSSGQIKHYWYGVHYAEAEQYYQNSVAAITSGTTFVSVDAYSSTDLVNWKSEGSVLTRSEITSHDVQGSEITQWLGRVGVAYLASINKYALIIQHETGPNTTSTDSKKVLIATANSPTGPFRYDRRINMKDYGLGTTNTGDQSVFQDTDGKSYLVYSHGSGRSKQWVAEIGVNSQQKVDLLNPTKMYDNQGREGNTMFKYAGRYYLVSSDLFGWNASRIHYLVSNSIWGPYTPTNQTQIMDGSRDDFGHVSQTGFYYTVHGSVQDTVIHCGDRWSDFAGNGIGYNVWDPLSIDGDGTPHFNSMSQWNLNSSTGEWSVGRDNNYILNGSFEADRARAPYQDKDTPKGDITNIAGWQSSDLNTAYNEADKDSRVGNFNLTFWASKDYTASIKQTISPQRYALPSGSYTLKVQVLKSADIQSAKLTFSSGSNKAELDFKSLQNNAKWRMLSTQVTVSGSSAEISVSVTGKSGQSLKLDDFELVRNSN